MGEHDFASFGRPTQGDSTVRAIFSAEWRQGWPHWLHFDVVGNAFLRGHGALPGGDAACRLARASGR